ncbi:hypothetical protein [Sanguibacter sp. Z1732]|uniref:hypothetical protein n=1 Tax=Sanguibacter sp. Z1732 TaxID=3435412 RepID=UPI003D9CB0BD
MNTEPDDPAALSLTDRWRRFWYLQTVALWLDPIPRRRRKDVLRELKANLGVAAGRDGMSAAISDHGRPRALARQYLDAEPTAGPPGTTGPRPYPWPWWRGSSPARSTCSGA